MLVTRISALSGKTHCLEIDISTNEINRIQNGEHVQRVVPRLPPEIREFLITGITPQEWNEHFGEKDGE